MEDKNKGRLSRAIFFVQANEIPVDEIYHGVFNGKLVQLDMTQIKSSLDLGVYTAKVLVGEVLSHYSQ